jgi:osmotically-inducible protein OsmY
MFLDRQRHPNWRTLDVFVRGETVIIHGRLASALEKRQALQCCRHVAGVLRVVDEIEVETPTRSED